MPKLKTEPSPLERELSRLPTRPRFKSIRELELSPNDLDRFCAELRMEFPTIRFLLDDYMEHWIERKFRDPSHPDATPNYRGIESETMRPPHGEPMPYADSFRKLPRDRHLAWVEPPGWKPQWSAKPYRRGRYVLLNRPQLEFVLFPPLYSIDRGPNDSEYHHEPPRTPVEGEICSLYGGFMFGRYYLDDLEQQEFLRRVWRIARRISTNKLVYVDGDTLQASKIPVHRSIRVGLDALEWTRRDRRHLIGTNQYFFRAADAFFDGV